MIGHDKFKNHIKNVIKHLVIESKVLGFKIENVAAEGGRAFT